MIPKSYKGKDILGRKATINSDTRNKGGNGIGAGATVTITGVVRGKGVTIKTEKCPHCGQYAYITGVSREQLTLKD